MLQLTLAYIQQADREREIATDLQNRQILRSPLETGASTESPAPTRVSRRAPVSARAATR